MASVQDPPNGPKMSLDYVLENCLKDSTGCYNPYITAFSKMPFIAEIMQLTRDYYAVRQLMNHRQLKKELTESFAAVCLAERALRSLHPSPCYDGDLMSFEALRLHQDHIAFFDICCGKGILSFILTLLFPQAKIFMLDHNGNMNLEYLSGPRFINTKFLHADLFLDSTFNDIQGSIHDLQQRGYTTLGFGLHLCGHLSPRLVHYFNEIDGMAALVISPCCMPVRRKGGKQINDLIRKTKWSGYDYWCMSVYTGIDDELARKDLVRDEHVLSEKCINILAFKKPTA